MSNDIKNVLDNYILQLKNLQNQLHQLQRTNDPNKTLGDEIGAKFIGALACGISESKDIGRFGEKIACAKFKADQKNQQTIIFQNCDQGFNILIGQIRPLLESISIKKSNLSKEGNSHILLKKLATVERSY